MSISDRDRYEQMFKHWHFASEVRLKLLAGLWAVYIGLAAVFAWIWSSTDMKSVAFVIPLLGLIATILHWHMDDRNGGAIRASKEIIEGLEDGARVPKESRLVAKSEPRGKSHASAITACAWVMGLLLAGATIYLVARSM